MALGSPDGVPGNRAIKRDELPAMPNGERKQVEISELAWSVNSRRISDTRVEQTEVIRPELVDGTCAGFPKPFHYCAHRHRIRIRRMRHDAHTAVFGYGTGCPTGARMDDEPFRRAHMQ